MSHISTSIFSPSYKHYKMEDICLMEYAVEGGMFGDYIWIIMLVLAVVIFAAAVIFWVMYRKGKTGSAPIQSAAPLDEQYSLQVISMIYQEMKAEMNARNLDAYVMGQEIDVLRDMLTQARAEIQTLKLDCRKGVEEINARIRNMMDMTSTLAEIINRYRNQERPGIPTKNQK